MSFTSLSRSLPRTRRISVGKVNVVVVGVLEEDGLERILLICFTIVAEKSIICFV